MAVAPTIQRYFVDDSGCLLPSNRDDAGDEFVFKAEDVEAIFQPGVAYMPVPRCDTCRYWGRIDTVPDVPVVGECVRFERYVLSKRWDATCDRVVTNVRLWEAATNTRGDFGCVQHEPDTDAKPTPTRSIPPKPVGPANVIIREGERTPREIPRPVAPLNRVIKEGEQPCKVCGSGKRDHTLRDHPYSPEPSLLRRLVGWLLGRSPERWDGCSGWPPIPKPLPPPPSPPPPPWMDAS